MPEERDVQVATRAREGERARPFLRRALREMKAAEEARFREEPFTPESGMYHHAMLTVLNYLAQRWQVVVTEGRDMLGEGEVESAFREE